MTKPLQFFSYQNGQLSSEGISISDIIKKTGTPVYIYSKKAFLKPLRELQTGLAGLDSMVCYALKANSNLSILSLLAEQGAGMDLVSGGELYRSGKAKVPAERIVFSGVGKTPEEIQMALNYQSQGIYSFNVESIPELKMINQIALSLGKRAPVALRFNPDVNPKTHPYISTGLKKNKFGMNKNEVISAAKALKELPGIQLKGISIHIGSQLLSLSPLEDAYIRLKQLILDLDQIIQDPLAFVDLGGGVGITYKNEKAPSLASYCKLIKKHFSKSFPVRKPLKVLIEPGRTLSGNSGILVSKVLFRKQRKDKDFLIIDAAMNDLIRPALYESHHEIIPVLKSQDSKKRKKTNIVGPVCESSDCFASDRPFSEKVDSGDLIAILSAGAYGFSMSSTYNSRPRPPEVLIDSAQFKVIRKREKYDNLIQGEE